MQIDSGETTFDLQDTTFVDLNAGSGAAYTATMYNTDFVVDDKLVTDNVTGDDDFGKGVCVIDNAVFVGAPEDEGNTDRSNDGSVGVFDLTVSGEHAWKNIASETAFIDIEKLGQVFEFSKGGYLLE